MRSRSAADDEGAAAAEFAIALPAVALVLAVCVAGIGVGSQQLRLQDAAADAARGHGRGEATAAVASRVNRAVPGAAVSVGRRGDLVCVVLDATARGPAAATGLALRAESCALDGGR